MGSNGNLDFAKYIKEEVGGVAIEEPEVASPVDDFAENTSLVDDLVEPASPQPKQLIFDAPKVTREQTIELFKTVLNNVTGFTFEQHLYAQACLQLVEQALNA